jgi:2-polyprenyl-6-methoxyphenol hydroxylase-like FAD-dependent oxidoreductase
MAIGVTPPSLEILHALGLDIPLRDRGVPVRFAEVHEARRRLGRLDFSGIDSPYPYFLSVPQESTTDLLRQNLARFPSVRLQCGVEFEGLTACGDRVMSRWRHLATGVSSELVSDFLIGCDGHRSQVRTSAGLAVREHTYPQRFVMGDFLDRSGLGTEARLFFAPEASVESFPLPDGWRRWILLLTETPGPDLLNHLMEQVHRLTGYSLEGLPVRFVSTFGAKRMAVNRFHAGRVFLAGDAAHVMSSIGGQGMNTGFADAEMLAQLIGRALADPTGLPLLAAAYERVRRRAFEVAATRAERGMWLGTQRGCCASLFRHLLFRWVLFAPWLQPRLAPHFAMLTIPFCNLRRVSNPWPLAS